MSDQIRIAQMIDAAKQCNSAVALRKAQSLYGNTPRYQCSLVSPSAVQSSSQYLSGKVAACPSVIGTSPVPESTRIARLQQQVLDKETDPLNPDTRFKSYTRFFPIPCPPVQTVVNLPKASTACPLPNSAFNPVLPA
jgi:hypothetical protein